MQGRTFPLPALLALSVAAAIGSCTLALASRTKATDSAQTSSWECSAGLHQDWSCSPGVGEPYTKPLEQVRKYSKTMRSGLDHIMQQAISPSQDLSQVEEEEVESDLIPNYPEDDPILGQLPDTAFDPDSNKEYRPSPSRSLADNDWVSRLTSTSSWPEDQSRLPERRPEPEQNKFAETEVSEEEVSRSVLLSDWLKRAQRKSSWVNKEETEDTVAELLGKRTESMERAAGESGEAPIFDKERDVYADDWLDSAGEKAVWADLDEEINTPPPDISVASLSNSIDAVEETEQETEVEPSPEDERTTADMKLVGSVTLDGGEPVVEAPLVATVSDSSPLLPSEKKKFKPSGLSYSLLAHQASGQTKGKYGGKDSIPPLSVQIAQQTMPAFQMQMRQAQQKGAAPISYPQPQFTAPEPVNSETVQPRLIQRGSLPDLEVTPAERLYKAAPQPSMPSNRQMPWKKHAAPEQWRHAPSGTQVPNGHYAEGPAVFASADNIELPESAHYRQELPPSPQTETAQNSLSVRSWSLTGENVAHVSPTKIVTPLPDREIHRQQPEPDWPEPQYKAKNRLAPSIPSYSSKTLWPGAENNRMMRKAKPAVSPETLRSYRRPPPVSPKDIYRLSTQEPTSAGRPAQPYEKETPFTQTAKKQPKGPSSADRLRQKTQEPTAALEPELPTPAPAPLPKVMTGLQQANFTAPIPSNPGVPATLTEMLNAPIGSVSIQWMATTQPGQIYTLQQRYPLLKQATTVRFNSKGQTWYILLSGIYPDAYAARAALGGLEWQSVAKRLNPWTRPLSGLKKLDLVRTNERIPLSQKEHSLPQGAYTIQWMKSDVPEVLRDIRNSYPQLSTAEIILLSRKSTMQYVLIQGRYPSNLAVKQVLKDPQLSSLARHLQAKPRPMASLKNSTQLIKKPVFTQVSVPMDNQISNILMAPEGSFTIQWLAANKPRMLNQLKQRYPELENAELVHFRRNHKDWYVLVQGQYSSSHEARQVLKRPELQRLANQLRPWARSVAGLRQVVGS
ncbi:hypothetical protein M3P05_06865 [Sansalvadorimonas sp. 2012CJ34-2]|uniref:SPOR domain-containing protein n=1 Tax=Parendozoicomonas callyspongiae TaxID=2942213 RepID=A0ABT0PEH8_9GAMM|nr:hypothetical protein [Sansalvadorimonas sp. 2012CJ34-2]MCL6269661.1 hypothetical protein [Sansalvadorimonas sp. 2012CJ34-2]